MDDIIVASEFESRVDLDNTSDAYQEFRGAEGVPVHTGLSLEDWHTVETGYWERTNQRGAFVNLYGAEGINDIQIHELEPNDMTSEQLHLYEEIVYVADGNGMTVVGTGDDQVIFEWETHALFFLPPSVPYRHVNTSDAAPACLVAETPLPQLLTMYQDPDILFDHVVDDQRSVTEEYYSQEPTIIKSEHSNKPGGVLSWVANFVPDMLKFDRLQNHQARGAGGTSVLFPMPETSMWAHISEFPVGTYKKAHRHHPGANVGVLSGEGFSLLWEEDWDEKVRIDWGPRTMFTPPAQWYHQHFNTGRNPARYFAMHGPKLGTLEEANLFDYRNPDNQIEYTAEDPTIRELYEAELAERGSESQMPNRAYEDPNYTFSRS